MAYQYGGIIMPSAAVNIHERQHRHGGGVMAYQWRRSGNNWHHRNIYRIMANMKTSNNEKK